MYSFPLTITCKFVKKNNKKNKNCKLCTFQPLNLCLDWNYSLKRQHAQLKTGPGQGLYEELHSVIERELIVKSSHTVIVKEGRLLLVRHLGWLWERLQGEMVKSGDWPKMSDRGTGTAHWLHTSCRGTTAARNKSTASLSKLFRRFDYSNYSLPLQSSVLYELYICFPQGQVCICDTLRSEI